MSENSWNKQEEDWGLMSIRGGCGGITSEEDWDVTP